VSGEEFSIYDLIDFAMAWWKLYAVAALIALGCGLLFFNQQPTTASISTDVTIYPAIPSLQVDAAAVELSEYLKRSLPDVEPTEKGYAITVPAEHADETAKLIATTIDKYESDLRARVAAAKAAAATEFQKHPDNEAVYNNFYQFQMLSDETELVSHSETVKVATPSRWRILVGFVASGLFIALAISMIISVFNQWRSRQRARLAG